MAWAYFSAGLLKLRLGGISYFDSLTTYAIQHSLDNLHDTQFKIAFLMPQFQELIPVATAVALGWEILFPLSLIFRSLLPWFLCSGLMFHVGTMLIMNITFPNQVAMYMVFVNWPSVFARLGALTRRVRASLALDRPSQEENSVAGRYWGIPEVFPGLILPASLRNQLLWDGDCGFCAAMVKRLHAFGQITFQARPYQDVQSELPAEVLQWSNRQMHWVSAEGHVLGGSLALSAVLAASGHWLLAALLNGPILRPFAWLGYRLVAGHRNSLGKVVGTECALPKKSEPNHSQK